MSNRHLARSTVLQALFEWDFNKKSDEDALPIFERVATEFSPEPKDQFMRGLFSGVVEKRSDLDMIITKAAPEWPLEKISVMDRNILRLGLYELLFSDRTQVPPKVAINEAIELAKTFGGETSSRFVNGVLGAVYKELGEPGKDEKSRHKIKNADLPDDKLPISHLAGAVVFARDKNDIYLALVHDVFGHWTLSKGKIKADEEIESGTIRAVNEELGLKIVIKETLGENEYIAYDPDEGKKKKHVHYFLAEASFQELKLGEKGGLDDARWFKLADILDLNFYNDILPIVTRAIKILLKK